MWPQTPTNASQHWKTSLAEMPKSSIRRDSVKGTKTKPPRMKYCGGSGASWRTKGRIAAHCKVSSFLASVRIECPVHVIPDGIYAFMHCIADCSVNVLICVAMCCLPKWNWLHKRRMLAPTSTRHRTPKKAHQIPMKLTISEETLSLLAQDCEITSVSHKQLGD